MPDSEILAELRMIDALMYRAQVIMGSDAGRRTVMDARERVIDLFNRVHTESEKETDANVVQG